MQDQEFYRKMRLNSDFYIVGMSEEHFSNDNKLDNACVFEGYTNELRLRETLYTQYKKTSIILQKPLLLKESSTLYSTMRYTLLEKHPEKIVCFIK